MGKLTIISGRAARRVLRAPSGRHTRPTTARTREALFSILTARLGGLHDLCTLDAFAGSGALGLEAWSRGAEPVVFVESHRPTLRMLTHNIETVGASPTHVIARPMPRALDHLPVDLPPFELVLLDPPYGHPVLNATLERLVATPGLLADDALVVVERDRESDFVPPANALEVVDERCYASSALTFLERTAHP